MTAALAMKAGDWQRCSSLLLGLRIWKLCPDAERVKAMLLTKIKEESMRAHLFAFSGFYESISLPRLWFVIWSRTSSLCALPSTHTVFPSSSSLHHCRLHLH